MVKSKEPEPTKTPIVYLHQLKKGDKIHAHTNRSQKVKEVITFDHVDGMYSYNTLPDGEVVHLGVMCPLVKVDDHYEIAFDREEDAS